MASSISHFASSSIIRCSISKDGYKTDQQNIRNSIKINGNSSLHTAKVDLLVKDKEETANTTGDAKNIHVYVGEQGSRQNIPTKKQVVDPFRQGLIVEGGVGYRQTVVVRSYEVGADKTATLEAILNLFQETALNHVWMSGLLGDGFGATHGMIKNNLIWVVSRMKVQVDHYPIWGEVLELDTWAGASGKHGMRRDWVLRSHVTGHVYARATSKWVMMNHQTRRLSKMPDEVRAEITPWLIEKQAIQEDISEKIDKLNKNATYINSGLQPKRSDLDMNQHVNNVKYVRWMLETIPDKFLETHQLTDIILEYRRECGSSDVVQSLCEPQEGDGSLITSGFQHNNNKLNGFSFPSDIIEGNMGLLQPLNPGPSSFTHLIQLDGTPKNEEIVRGKTAWKKKFNVPRRLGV